GEPAADNHHVVRLDDDGGNKVVDSRPEVNRGIQRPVRIKPGDSSASHSAGLRISATEHNFLIFLHDDREYDIVGAPPWSEGWVDAAIGRQPGNMAQSRTVHGGEQAANDHASISLQINGADGIIRAGLRIEAGVQRTIGVEARDMIPRDAINRGKITADQDLPAVDVIGGIDLGRVNRPVCPQARVERCVNSAIVIELGNATASGPVDGGETAAQEKFAHGVCAKDSERLPQGINRVIRASTEVEAGIQRTIHIKPREIMITHAVEDTKLAAHEDAARATAHAQPAVTLH